MAEHKKINHQKQRDPHTFCDRTSDILKIQFTFRQTKTVERSFGDGSFLTGCPVKNKDSPHLDWADLGVYKKLRQLSKQIPQNWVYFLGKKATYLCDTF